MLEDKNQKRGMRKELTAREQRTKNENSSKKDPHGSEIVPTGLHKK